MKNQMLVSIFAILAASTAAMAQDQGLPQLILSGGQSQIIEALQRTVVRCDGGSSLPSSDGLPVCWIDSGHIKSLGASDMFSSSDIDILTKEFKTFVDNGLCTRDTYRKPICTLNNGFLIIKKEQTNSLYDASVYYSSDMDTLQKVLAGLRAAGACR